MDREQIIQENSKIFIEQQLFKDKMRFLSYFFSPRLLKVRKEYNSLKAAANIRRMIELAMTIENSKGYLRKNKLRHWIDDFIFFMKYGKPGKF